MTLFCWSSPVFGLTRLTFTLLVQTNDCLCLWLQFSLIIIVLVKNLNDNPPMFQEPVYKFNVSEVANCADVHEKAPFPLRVNVYLGQ